MYDTIIRIEALSDDNWTCRCGNRPDVAGFQPCNTEGIAIEFTEAEWAGLYCCQHCTLILDSRTYDPVDQTVTAVAPEMVVIPDGLVRTWTDAEQENVASARAAREVLESTRLRPLCGDAVEFTDGVVVRLAEDPGGWFGIPEDHHEWTVPPRLATATRFELAADGTMHYRAKRALTDTAIDPGELDFVGRRHRATTIHTADTRRLRFQIGARVWAAHRISPTATLARIRSLTRHTQQRPFIEHAPEQDRTTEQGQALELMTGLDFHLARGGWLPQTWSQAQPPATAPLSQTQLLAQRYSAEIEGLTRLLGSAQILHVGGGCLVIAARIGSRYAGRGPLTALIANNDPGLAGPGDEHLHWLVRIEEDDSGEIIAQGHSLIRIRDAVDIALSALQDKVEPSEDLCPCLIAAGGGYLPFTPGDVAHARRSYQEFIAARPAEGSKPDDLAAEELAAELELNQRGLIVHHNTMGTGDTLQFIRVDDERIMAYASDHGVRVGVWDSDTLTGEIINHAWGTHMSG
ncbi:hypothetical protein [Nocardia noduli]|uniref:hypothetical protein n=1 Tax=Nocardia noduli TaxID=2815722 RepID=UPI001C226F9B|nr:hypothetical protein [Nocardia noduli]